MSPTVLQGLLSACANRDGIIPPTTVGISTSPATTLGLGADSASLLAGSTFRAGSRDRYTGLPAADSTGPSVVLGPPMVFGSTNLDQYSFQQAEHGIRDVD